MDYECKWKERMNDNLYTDANDYSPCVFCDTVLYVGDDFSMSQQPPRGIHPYSNGDVRVGAICQDCEARLIDLGKRRISALTRASGSAAGREDVVRNCANHAFLVEHASLRRLLRLQNCITPPGTKNSLASGPRLSELWGTLGRYDETRTDILHFLSIESLRMLLREYAVLVSAPLRKAYAEALERGWLSPDLQWHPEPEGSMTKHSQPGARCPGCGKPSDGGSREFAGPPTCCICYELFGNLDDVSLSFDETMSWPAYAPNASIQQIHGGLDQLTEHLRTLYKEALNNGWLAGPPGDLDSLEARTRAFEQMVESGDYLNAILR